MQLTRQEKEALVDDLADKMDEYPVVGVLDMHSLPARQLQEIKKELVDDADITMTRKTLIHLALEQSDREDITDLKENTAIQPALIFTEQNPFTLYKTIQEKKTSAPASAGDIAPNDITVEAGKTDLDPGPMLGRIQELGANTSVEDGKIKIENDAVAVEEGETISADTAEILNNLGMEPLEVGLDLKVVYQDGDVFDKDTLAIDPADYRRDLEAAASRGFNLAVNAGFITEQTAVPLLQEAVRDARNLGVNAGVIDEELIDDLLAQAASHAEALDRALDLDSIDIDAVEESDEEDEGDAEADASGEDTDEASADEDGDADEDTEAADDDGTEDEAADDAEQDADDNDATDEQTSEEDEQADTEVNE